MAKSTEKTSKAIVEIRKAPRIIPFVITAAVIGLVISAITALVINAPASFFGYVVGWGTIAFAAILDATKIEG